jgi:hypothetical protein
MNLRTLSVNADSQQRRVPCIDKIDDAQVSLGYMFAVKSASVLL